MATICKAGETVTVRITFELSLNPASSCTAQDLKEITITKLINEGLPNDTVSFVVLGQSESKENTDDTTPIGRGMLEAAQLWADLRERRNYAADKFPNLTNSQLRFVRDCLASELEVIDYSGRGMYGTRCPAVIVSNRIELQTDEGFSEDNMGHNLVLYCP